jgi:hypothetical protein
MPDSQPPNGGPGPYDGWDLDRLLSGENVLVPEGLRPVAAALDALRVAPMRGELAAEEAARTAFRQVMLSGGSGPVWPVAGTGEPRTLVLATQAADGESRPVPRPQGCHRRRRPPRRGPWQAKALVGAAAAVVIVGATALASTLSSSGGHPGQLVHSLSATGATARSSGPGSPGLEGTATKEPTAKPTPKASQQSVTGAGTGSSGASALCRQYLASFTHPGQSPDGSAPSELDQQLSALAGGSMNVGNYCTHVLQPWAAMPQGPGNNDPGMPGPGYLSPGDSQGSKGSQGSQGMNRSPGRGGNESAGNAGNDQGRNGPGAGSQGRP